MKKNALIHVEDAEGLEELASFLVNTGWEIFSAGPTEEFLRAANIPVTHESDFDRLNNSSPSASELHYHILSTRTDDDIIDEKLNLSHPGSDKDIQLVCMNFNPVLFPITKEQQLHDMIHPATFFATSILRTAYNNAKNVLILSDPADYKEAIIQLRTDNVTQEFKSYLGAKTLNLISAYDSGIAYSLLHSPQINTKFMNYLTIPFKMAGTIRNGANKYQQAGLYYYPTPNSKDWGFSKIAPDRLNYTIVNDLSLAWKLISTLYKNLKNMLTVQCTNADGYAFQTQFTPLTGTVFTIATKYESIIGAGLSTNAVDSFLKTNTFDKEITEVSLGCSSVIDEAAAREIIKSDYVAIVAPGFTAEAKEILSQKSELRLISSSDVTITDFEGKLINGGILVQLRESNLFETWQVKTKNRPSQYLADQIAFGTLLTLGARTHSAVLLKENRILGIGQACTSNKRAILAAIYESNNQPAEVLVCDTPILFNDAIRQLIDNGLQAILQPGGTPDDKEFTQYCDEHGTIMVFTNMTHITF